MNHQTDLKAVSKYIEDVMETLDRSYDFPNYFYQAFLSGENQIVQKEISEVKVFDETWIDVIEKNLVSIDKIMKYPKSGLRYEQNVEAIEKAKKVNASSIRHLAANTHLIKEIRQQDVILKKILTTQAEIEDAIYENRFVKTLIDRLFDFVNQRYQSVKKHVAQAAFKHFELNSDFELNESKINMKIEFNITEPTRTSNHENNVVLLHRIHSLLKLINGFKSSTFMDQLKNVKPVKAPILKTQILQKNVDYKNCYHLWIFLDQNTSMSFDLDVEEKNLTLDKKYLRQIYQQILSTFITIHGNQMDLSEHYQYLDTDQYTKKAPKISKKRFIQALDESSVFSYQEPEINEFYHEKNKKAFQKRLSSHEQDTSNKHLALKKAISETIHITNTLFEDMFELDVSDDYMLMQGKNHPIDDEINVLEEKIKVLKMIREAKESDYQRTIRQEKQLLKSLNGQYQEKVKQEKKRIKDTAKIKAIEEIVKLEKKQLKQNQQALNAHLAVVSELKDKIKNEQKSYQIKYKNKLKDIKVLEKEKIEAEKRRAETKYLMRLEKIESMRQQEVEQLSKTYETQKEVLETSFQHRIKEALHASNEKVNFVKKTEETKVVTNSNHFNAT